MRTQIFTLLIISVFLIMTNNQEVTSQSAERASIDLKYTWKLEDIYATDADWQVAKDKLKTEIDKFEKYQESWALLQNYCWNFKV